MQALGDSTRRALLDLLAAGELPAGELADRFPVSRPAISRHLRVLREAGLVRVRSDGRQRLYALDPGPLREIDDWLERYRDLWASRLDALDTEMPAAGGHGGRWRDMDQRREDVDLEARRGAVTTEADGRQRLEFRRSWPDPVEDVWAALTDPDRMARWIGTYEGERGPGGHGTFTMTHEEEQVGEPMRIVECTPPRRLVVAWVQEPEGSGVWRIDLDLSVEDDRTVLRFVQVFAADADVTDFAMGWHWYLDKLDAELGGRSVPGDWESFSAEVGPAYGRG
ncbi:metalloregulator ArsR/SmtB family transcription factor [Blastococcus sp. SYSU DS0539]